MFIAWGMILGLIVINHHISSVEMKTMTAKMKEALYSKTNAMSEEIQGMFLTTKTYKSTGRKQVILGLISSSVLLALYNTTPFYGDLGNTITYVFNGLVITALLGYTVEGIVLMDASEVSLSEDGGGEEIEN